MQFASTASDRHAGQASSALMAPSTARRVGLVLAAAYFAVVLLAARDTWHLHTGDTDNLVLGTRQALACLEDGTWRGCGWQGGIQTAVFPYPILQYLPAAALIEVGMSDGQVLVGLAVINLVAIVAAMTSVVVTFRRRPDAGLLVVMSLLGSSLLYHAATSFGEGLAAAILVMATCAAIARRTVATTLLVVLAACGKETLAPFVVALVLVCLRESTDRLLPPLRRTAPVVAGGAVAFYLSIAFNVFRFDSPSNLLYLSFERTPGLLGKLNFLAAILASPTSGVMWFWPVFTLLAVASTAVAMLRCFRAPRDFSSYLPTLCVTGLLGGYLAGLSMWYSPFGWIAYGPRIEVPLLGGLAVAYVHLVGDVVLSWLRTNWVALTTAAVVIAVGSLNAFAPWTSGKVMVQSVLTASPTCPDLTGLEITRDDTQYFECMDYFLWRVRPSVLNELIAPDAATGIAAWGLAIGASGFLLGSIILRRSASSDWHEEGRQT
jgi:hypothetical protein